MGDTTTTVAMTTCPHGGAWYMLCPTCGAVGILSHDHRCRACGNVSETREVSRREFEDATGRRF